MNQILLSASSNERFNEAAAALENRSLLINIDTKKVFVKINGEMVPIGVADGLNVAHNDNGEIGLRDDILVHSVSTIGPNKNNFRMWTSQVKIFETSSNNNIMLLFKADNSGVDKESYIGGELVEFGEGVIGHYQISLTASGSRLIKGATSFDKKAKLVLVKYNGDGEYYYGVRFKSEVPATIMLTGWYTIKGGSRAPSSYNEGDLSDIIELDDDSDTGTQVLEPSVIFENVNWEFTGQGWSGHLTEPFDFGNSLKWLDTEYSIYNRTGRVSNGNDVGYVELEVSNHTLNSPAIATFKVNGNCSIRVGWQSTGNARTIRLRELYNKNEAEYIEGGENIRWQNDYSVNNNRNGVTESVYNYIGDPGVSRTFEITHNGPVRFAYIRITYNNNITQTDYILNEIKKLPETGEDGSPHIIRMTGTITKQNILDIAENIRSNSSVQVVLDLSRATMDSRWVDWTADAPADQQNSQYANVNYLTNAFYNCVSLREFHYPHNVITSGANTFQNCTFLREVHFNPEMQSLGGSEQVWSWSNNCLFAGARCKTLFIPRSVNRFNGYPFSYSNVINLYFEEGSAFVNGGRFGQWNTWPHVKEQLTFWCPQDLYNRWHNDNFTWAQDTGADGDGIRFISTSCRRRDHVKLWTGTEDEIDYTV